MLILSLVIVVGIVYVVFSQFIFKSVSDYDVSKMEKCDVIYSPDHTKRINVYFNGGILGYTDYSYIGEIENMKNRSRRNIFLLPGENYDVSWLDNQHISINGKKMNIRDTYDFRKENK